MGSEDADSREAIIEATYDALRKHGYTAMTMQDIADEFGKSKSLLHYHYDTKDELLVAFIEQIVDEFEAEIESDEGMPPTERLRTLLDRFVFGPDDEEREAFHVALLELRTQAPYDEEYRDAFDRADRIFRDTLARIVADGIERGEFRDVDPDRTARLLASAIGGARTRQITLDDAAYTVEVRDALVEEYVEGLLLVDDHRDGGGDGEDGKR